MAARYDAFILPLPVVPVEWLCKKT